MSSPTTVRVAVVAGGNCASSLIQGVHLYRNAEPGTSVSGLMHVKLGPYHVWDSPNSAGVVIDAVRRAKLALDRGIGGALSSPSSYFTKSPPEQYTDAESRARTDAFIQGEADA